MFKNLKLSKKIGYSFGCIVLLQVIACGIAWHSLYTSSQSFMEYRETARDSNLMGMFQSAVLTARMNVMDYLRKPNDESVARFQKLRQDVENALTQMTGDAEISGEAWSAKLRELQQGFGDYGKGFDEIVRSTQECRRLDSQQLRPQVSALENLLSKVEGSREKAKDGATSTLASQAIDSLLRAHLRVRFYMENPNATTLEETRNVVRKLDEQVAALGTRLSDPQDRATFEQVLQTKKECAAAFENIIRETDARNAVLTSTLERLGPMLASRADEIKLGIKAKQDDLGPKLQASNQRALSVVLVGGILAVAVGIIFAVVITRVITRPVRATVAMLRDIAQGEGDLTKRLEVRSQDEIGEMALCFNLFVEKLQGIIGRLAQNTTSLSASSHELSATATQLAGGAEQTTSQSATVAAAAEQMSTNMNGMAAATEEMSTSVKVVASAVEELTASISEVARSAEQAATVAHSAAELAGTSNARIGELGSAADEIGKVIEVIQDIAEQTNLLALNATIEAARAGEAGKGFAVVATEVKELARQTAGATEDIRKRIEGIQGSTGEAVKSIADIGEVIQQVNELSRTIASAVEEQSITTKEIARNVSQSSAAAQTVAKGVAESASASQEITRSIVGVDQAAKQTAQGAAQTQNAGQELSGLAEQLQSLVSQFKVSEGGC